MNEGLIIKSVVWDVFLGGMLPAVVRFHRKKNDVGKNVISASLEKKKQQADFPFKFPYL